MTRYLITPALAGHRKRLGVCLTALLCLSTMAWGGSLEPFNGTEPPAGFSLEDLKGQGHSLEDYRGRILLINFWASWCPPCIREMPALERLEERMADRPFAIVAINTSEKKYKVRKFTKLIDLRLQVLLDPTGETFAAWGGEVLPTSFLLDTSGRISHIGLGPLEWDSEEVVSVIEAMLEPEPKVDPATPVSAE